MMNETAELQMHAALDKLIKQNENYERTIRSMSDYIKELTEERNKLQELFSIPLMNFSSEIKDITSNYLQYYCWDMQAIHMRCILPYNFKSDWHFMRDQLKEQLLKKFEEAFERSIPIEPPR